MDMTELRSNLDQIQEKLDNIGKEFGDIKEESKINRTENWEIKAEIYALNKTVKFVEREVRNKNLIIHRLTCPVNEDFKMLIQKYSREN